MNNPEEKCPVVIKNINGSSHSCSHTLYKDHDCCIFHSPKIKEKKEWKNNTSR
ncbi:MAG: hypothetical protein GY754_47345 [bacterium]|nr:hypothetical protein [bacterium]